MNRQEKEQFVSDFHSKLESAKVLLISHYKGLNVVDISNLRKSAKDQNATFKVTKNSLARIAIKDTSYENLDFSKQNKNLKIIGGAIGQKELSVDEIKTLASLPSLEELRAKIVGLISSPLSNIIRLIEGPSSSLARIIKKKPKTNEN